MLTPNPEILQVQSLHFLQAIQE